MIKTVVLASGRGTNFAAAIQAIQAAQVKNCQITALIVDRVGTGAEELARSASIPVFLLDYKKCENRSEFDNLLTEKLRELQPDLILALGFMRILPGPLIDLFPMKIINIHPSLLPAFPGLSAQKQAYDYGARISGATIHFVDRSVDTGPIILQAAVQIPGNGTLEELIASIRAEEHRLVVETMALFCSGKISVDGRKVLIHGT